MQNRSLDEGQTVVVVDIMEYFDRHPNVFRALLSVLVVYLLGIGISNLAYTISTTTDENLFIDAPSKLYIVKGFKARLETKRNLPIPSSHQVKDSVRSGNLLLSINGNTFTSASEAIQAVQSSREEYSTIAIMSLGSTEKLSYRVRTSQIPNNFLRDIPHTAFVTQVFPGGASDQAGMQVGDLIVSINGQRFDNVLEADRIMRAGRVGATINYEILRNNATRTLHITLARLRFTFPLFAAFLCGLIYIGTGLFLGYKRPKLAAARLLALASVCIGYLWLAFNNAGVQVNFLTVARGLTFFPTVFFGIAFWHHSRLYFPVEQPLRLAQPWLYRIPYAIAAIMSLGFVTFPFFYASAYGNLFLTAGVFLLTLFLIGVQIAYSKQVPPDYKRMSAPIRRTAGITGATFGVIALLSQIFQELNTPAVLLLMLLGAASLPFVYLYIIGRYRLLGLHLRVRRNIQYMVLSSVWVVSVLIIAVSTLYLLTQLNLDVPNIRFTGTAMEIPREPITLQERMVLEKITLMIASICFMFAFWEIGRAGQNFINRMYYRSDYDYKQASLDFADVIATRLTLQDLCSGIVQRLVEIVHLKRVGIVIFQESTASHAAEYSGETGETTLEVDVVGQPELRHVNAPLCINALQQFHGGFSVDYLPRELKETMRARGFMHLVPIRSKDTVIGALAIGEKMSEAAVEREDLAFLETVSRQAAVAIENAFLYEEIAEQDRLRHELALAREIQLASLPQITPDIPGLDIAGMSHPALEVGGDYFDYLDSSTGAFTVIVGDVSGKGTSAALYMSKIQGILRSLHSFSLSPRDLLVRTNQLLHNDLEKKGYVTTLSASFAPEKRCMQVARAGHLPLLHFRADNGSVERIQPRGLGLGMVGTAVFAPRLEETTLYYKPGDIFLFVTDGITEAMNLRREEFGEDQLLEVLRSGTSACAREIRDRICHAVQTFTGEAPLHDDFTVVVVKAIA